VDIPQPGHSLRAITYSGGNGFCYSTISAVAKGPGCGPLLIALDSNIVIDLQDHGATLINGDELEVADRAYEDELTALGVLIDVWLLRDIRFLVLPAAYTDAKRRADSPKVCRRRRSIERLSEALCFQLEDWELSSGDRYRAITKARREDVLAQRSFSSLGLPEGADSTIYAEACIADVDVFLTRDNEVLAAGARTPVGWPTICSPVDLVDVLAGAGVGIDPHGGLVAHAGCPYPRDDGLAPDTGKWVGLLQVFEED
jgi:hypothetical protein